VDSTPFSSFQWRQCMHTTFLDPFLPYNFKSVVTCSHIPWRNVH